MKKKGFTLIELMVVILIVGILAAASVPLMRGRIDKAKWAEANAMAGTIQTAARVYFVENGNVTNDLEELGFEDGDLTGTYFDATCFAVGAADENGKVSVTVTGTGTGKSPSGSYTLSQDGTWAKTGD
jgi:type IV pilus assembly protein PilA